MSNQTKNQTRHKTGRLSVNTWVKIAVLSLIVLSTVVLLTTHVVLTKMKQDNEDLQNQALELEQENNELQDYISHKDTDEGVKEVAQDQLGMVDPDTVIYDFD